MRNVKVWWAMVAAAVLAVLPVAAAAQTATVDQVLDRIIAQEKAEILSLRQYSPLVETYIQNMRKDRELGAVPNGDKYFLGKAQLAKGVDLESLAGNDSGGVGHKLGSFLFPSMEFLPKGFLQMIYLDNAGLDRQNYKFDYVRREFLGEVRCLVFDVTPTTSKAKGHFMGRIWVEDRDFHIVRFNGAYTGSTRTNYYFHFDSWRVFSGPNQWLPAFIYSEEHDLKYAFKAQTRLWGYNLGQSQQEQELSKILVEASIPVKDQAEPLHDYSPLQAQRAWDQQAEDNVLDRMERLGLLSPPGEVDKVLETVVNNLEVTNNLDVEIRCRVLVTSTLESFTLGHAIVLSRGLVDVLPDEASLATILAHELGHVVLSHRIDSQYAFFDRMLFDEKDTFRHFGFARTPEEEKAANQKGAELLKNSPYKDQLATPALFIEALQKRVKEVPNLISPHLGDKLQTSWTVTAAAPSAHSVGLAPPSPAKPAANVLAALPLGGRVKMNPWSDELTMLKTKPVGNIAEREKMPFEVTPFVVYLTRDQAGTPTTAPVAVSSQPEPAINQPTDFK